MPPTSPSESEVTATISEPSLSAPSTTVTMPSLESLPYEIDLMIVQNLDNPFDLAALALTCRGTYGAANQALYSLAARHHAYLLCWACQFGNAGTARLLLDAGVDPNMPYQSLEITNWKSTVRPLGSRRALAVWYDHDSQMERYKYHYHQKAEDTEGWTHHKHIDEVDIDPFPWDKPSSEHFTIGANPYRKSTLCFPSDLDNAEAGAPWDPNLDQCFNKKSWGSLTYPLHSAVMGGHSQLVEMLLQVGVSTQIACSRICSCVYPFRHDRLPRWTPLHIALCFKHDHIARLLIAREASLVTDLARPSMTALHDASARARTSVMEFLVNGGYGQDVNALDSNGLTPLWYALLSGDHDETLPWLLDHGATTRTTIPKINFTMLQYACFSGAFHAATKLVDAGAEVNSVCPESVLPEYGPTRALELCCFQRYPRLGAYERRSLLRDLSLHLPPRREKLLCSREVFETDRLDTVEHLLKAGASARKHHGGLISPMAMAASLHSVPLLEILQKWNADLTTDYTILPRIFVSSGCGPDYDTQSILSTFHWLLQRGAPVDPRPTDLMANVLFDLLPYRNEVTWRTEALFTLLEHGGSRHVVNRQGDSLLLTAFRSAPIPICYKLVQLGFQPEDFDTFVGCIAAEDTDPYSQRVSCPGCNKGVSFGSDFDPNEINEDQEARLRTSVQFLVDIDTNKTFQNCPMRLIYLLQVTRLPPSKLLLQAVKAEGPQSTEIRRIPKCVPPYFDAPDWVDSRVNLLLRCETWDWARSMLENSEGLERLGYEGSVSPTICHLLLTAPAPSVVGRQAFNVIICEYLASHWTAPPPNTNEALLRAACRNWAGNMDISHFLKPDVDVNAVGSDGDTALGRILERLSRFFSMNDAEELTALENTAATLVQWGADPRIGKDKQGRCPLVSYLDNWEFRYGPLTYYQYQQSMYGPQTYSEYESDLWESESDVASKQPYPGMGERFVIEADDDAEVVNVFITTDDGLVESYWYPWTFPG